MAYCSIERNNNGEISRVKTRDGNKSILFDKIASIPHVLSKEKALSLYENVFSNKFLNSFGTWYNNSPKNKKAVNKIRKSLDGRVTQDVVDRVIYAANSMNNPKIVTNSVKPQEYSDVRGNFYTEDLDMGTDIFLYDDVVSNSIKVDEIDVPDGMTIEEEENTILSADYNQVVYFDSSNGNSYTIVREEQQINNINTLAEADNKNPLVYENGEPKLFFMVPSGEVFTNYASALKATQVGNIEIGFISSDNIVEARDESSLQTLGNDVVYIGDKVKLNNPNSFTSIASMDSASGRTSRSGMINFLIRTDILSGSRKIINGNYYLFGAGAGAGKGFANSRIAYNQLETFLGNGFVKWNGHGGIEFTNKVPWNKAQVKTKNGRIVTLDKAQIKKQLMEGRYSELSQQYEDMDFLATTIFLESEDVYGNNNKTLYVTANQKERELQVAMLSIMQSLGLSAVKLTDYLENYSTRVGKSISVDALANLSKQIIALAEGSNVYDLVEEVSHFLVEMYENQSEIDSLHSDIENTPEWASDSGRYYQIYSKEHSGEALERIVHREILGKMLANEIASRFTKEANTESEVRVRNWFQRLLDRLINLFRSNYSNQSERLDSLVREISDLALNSDMYAFNSDFLADKNFEMYSAGDVSAVERLTKYVDNLDSRVSFLSRLKQPTIEIKSQIDNLKNEFERGSELLAFKSLNTIANGQLKALENQIKAAQNEKIKNPNKAVWDYSKQQNLENLNSLMVPLLEELQGVVTSSSIDKAEKKALLESIDAMPGRLNALRASQSNLLGSDTNFLVEKFVKVFNVDENGAEFLRDQVKKRFKDIGVITSLFGSLEHSSNPYLSLLSRLVSRARYAANMAAKEMTDELARSVENGWNINRFRRLLSAAKTGYSSYLKNKYDFDAFNEADQTNTIEILKSLPTIKGAENPYKNMSVEDIKKIKRKDKFLGGMLFTRTGIPSARDLNPEERSIFNAKKDLWNLENTERRMTDEYYDNIEKRYNNAAQNRDAYSDVNTTINPGDPITQQSIEFFRNLSRRRNEIKDRFRENGRVNWDRLNADEEAVLEMNEINRSRKAAKSDYYMETGLLKTGDDMRLAKDIQAMDKQYNLEREEDVRNNGPRSISGEYMQTLRRIKEQRGNAGAFEFFMNNGRLGFSSEFWGTLGEGSFNQQFGEIDWYNTDLTENEADEIIEYKKELDELRVKRSDILKQYVEFNNPIETDYDGMPKVAVDNIKQYSEEMDSKQSVIMALAKKAGIESGALLDSEYVTNNAYEQTFADSGLQNEMDFVKQHVTTTGLSLINAMERNLMSFQRNNALQRFSSGQRRFIAEYYGWGDLSDAKDEFYYRLQDMSLTKADVDKLAVEYGKTKLLPYFKRFAPKGYTTLMNDLSTGRIEVDSFVESLLEGNADSFAETLLSLDGYRLSQRDSNPEVEALYRNYSNMFYNLSVDLQNEWYEDSSNFDQYLNPNYDHTGEYGYRQPKMSKYRNNEYYDYFGIRTENGVDIATKNVEDWNMIQILKNLKRESLRKYNEKDLGYHNLYMIPQISKSKVERMEKFAGSPLSVIKNTFKDTFFSRVDDPEYGQDTQGATPEDNSALVMPKYYLYKLENSDDVSTDLAYSYMMLASQSAQYEANLESMGDFMAIGNELRNSQFEGGKRAEDTNTYKMYKEWYNAYVLGVRQNKKLVKDIYGYQVDFGKAIHFFDRLVRTANIAVSPIIASTAATTYALNIAVERAVGEYIDGDSFSLATQNMPSLAANFINEYGKVNRVSRCYVLGERFKIFNIRERSHSAGYNRLIRSMSNIEYKLMEVLNSPMGPNIMSTVLYGFRVHNGKFVNFNEFKKSFDGKASNKEIKSQWKAMRSMNLYDTLQVNEDGKIVYRQDVVDTVGREEIDRISERAQREIVSLNSKCDGVLSEEDKSTATRNFFLNFTTAHRGWFTIAFQRRWKHKQYNFSTNRIEEGTYWTLWNFGARVFDQFRKEKNVNNMMQAIKDNWNTLEDYERSNFRRILVDLGTMAVLGALSVAFAGMADDDDNKDNWMVQFMAFIGLRTINEMYSVTEPFLTRNAIDMAENPFVPIRQLSELVNPANWSTDEVKSGAYEGHSKLYKMLVKQTYFKHYYNLKTAEDLKKSADYWRVLNQSTLPFAQKEKKEK